MDVMDVAIPNSIGPAAAGLQHTSVPQASTDSDSEDGRWREWKRKGRDEDARFRRRLRTVVVDVAGVLALAGALWFTSVTWL
jgi:hypothetical protein